MENKPTQRGWYYGKIKNKMLGFAKASIQPTTSDIIGNLCPSIVDSEFTKVVDGDLVKVLV